MKLVETDSWKTINTKQKTIKTIFKDCLPQIILGPFLNTLTQMLFNISKNSNLIASKKDHNWV